MSIFTLLFIISTIERERKREFFFTAESSQVKHILPCGYWTLVYIYIYIYLWIRVSRVKNSSFTLFDVKMYIAYLYWVYGYHPFLFFLHHVSTHVYGLPHRLCSVYMYRKIHIHFKRPFSRTYLTRMQFYSGNAPAFFTPIRSMTVLLLLSSFSFSCPLVQPLDFRSSPPNETQENEIYHHHHYYHTILFYFFLF